MSNETLTREEILQRERRAKREKARQARMECRSELTRLIEDVRRLRDIFNQTSRRKS